MDVNPKLRYEVVRQHSLNMTERCLDKLAFNTGRFPSLIKSRSSLVCRVSPPTSRACSLVESASIRPRDSISIPVSVLEGKYRVCDLKGLR